MSATGLDVFDRTIQTTNIWLNEIMDDLGPDRHAAYRALGAVLHALRDRMTIEEAAHLSAQLPLLVRGVFFDTWRPAEVPLRIRSVDEFLDRVASELRDIRPVDPAHAVHSVCRTLGKHVSQGEIEQVRSQLPEQIRRLWPEPTLAQAAGAKPGGDTG
jgi:uncharacterized protein (DUF2267 family)